jgi:outer membrane protein assembly factor BamB
VRDGGSIEKEGLKVRVRAAVMTVSIFLGLAVAPAIRAHAAGVTVSLSPTFGPPTTKDKVQGSGFPAADSITISFDGATVAGATTNAKGKFSATFVVPATATPGAHTVTAFDPAGLGGSAAFLVQTNWNSSRFDPTASGFNPYENVLSTANVANLSQLANPQWGAFVHSAPVYAGGNLYAGSSDGTVRAFDGVGRQLWSFTSGGAVLGSPVAVARTGGAQPPGPSNDCAIVAGSQDGNVYGLNPATGAMLWSFAAGAPISTSPEDPTAVETIYVVADNGSVFALNGCTGAPSWSDVAQPPGPANTPAVLSGVKLSDGTTRTIIVVCFGGGTVEALDAGTGTSLWSVKDPGPISAPAGYGSGKSARVVFGAGASVVELNASTGKRVWSFATGGTVSSGVGLDEIVTAASTTAGPDLKLSLHAIIASDDAGDLYALNPKTGAKLWGVQPPGPAGFPTIANGVVYAEHDPGPINDGALLAFDASNGTLLFSADLGAQPPGPQGSPAVADGRVFTGDFTGGLRIFGVIGTT